MKRHLMFLTIILELSSYSALGQTANEIASKYGEPIKAYTVSEHIWMTPEYNVEGGMCKVRLYPRRIDANANFLYPKLPFEELVIVLNQLAPPESRGPKKEPFGVTVSGGGASWTTYTYEKVVFTFINSFRIDLSKSAKPYVFSEQTFRTEDKPERANSTPDEFYRSKESSAEIVAIKWSDRGCDKVD
jgi:hypothetical protein